MNEKDLQINICRWLKLQYPEVIFTSESSGLRLTIGQARSLAKQRSGKGLPDLMIFEPRGDYHGLFIELKREGEKVFRRDGQIRSDAHLQDQYSVINRLNDKGYLAEFAIGFDEARALITKYMKQ
jgi:hypothetical protein